MIIALILLGILAVILLGHMLIYRRQVAGLSRQLAFINQNKTQAQPQVDLHAPELNELVRQISILNDRLKNTELTFFRQDEALRETIANLSHDIRTPLTSLDGYFQLLSAEGVSQEKKEYYVGIIKSRLESLTAMLDELFTYAKLQDPNYDIETAPMDMTAVTAETLLSFYDDIKKNGEDPQINIPEKSIEIRCNKGAYIRIIQNIIKNALVHGKNLTVKLCEDNGEAVFACGDELLNADEHIDITRVFERFYKADKARSGKGSGLGLAISKELTEKMGGRIEAACEAGVFTITLAFPLCN
ncbi:MAG: HAMP domain-containing histidine kinase [Lachnospiraceae bacterium]|nr:HAMP domain-containing histidine kinase [Lachnospiraceae bacterium]